MNAMHERNYLPDGFSVRAPRLDEAAPVANLINAEDLHEVGRAESEAEDVSSDWQREGIDPAQDSRVVCTPDDQQVVGYETIYIVHDDGRFLIDGYVHPTQRNRGIGTHLLRWVEGRVRERMSEVEPSTRISVEASTYGTNTHSHRMFEAEGYSLARLFWRMETDLTAPPELRLPDGITIRTAVIEQDAFAIYQTVHDSFADHWGFSPFSYESWRKGRFETSFFDPSLWFLAMHGSELAGVALCRVRADQNGWINTVGVRRAFRRRGIASALLKHAFAEFFRRGYRNVGLGVDSQSLTGATHVYEQAGMHVTRQYKTFEKTLREGNRSQSDERNAALNS